MIGNQTKGIILTVVFSAGLLSHQPLKGSRTIPGHSDVRVALTEIHNYADDHRGVLPKTFEDLYLYSFDPELFSTLVYVAPIGATMDLPEDTAIVLFPWDSGVHVGYLNGRVEYLPGGYGAHGPPHHRRLIERLKTGMVISFAVNAFLLVILLLILIRHRCNQMLTNRGREQREAGPTKRSP